MAEHGEFLKSLFTDRSSAVKEFLNEPPTPLDDGGKEEDQKIMDSITVNSIMKSYAMKEAPKGEAYWYYKNKGYLKKLGLE